MCVCVCRQSEPVSFSYTACIPHLKVNNSLMTGDPPVREPWHLLPMCTRARGERCLYRSLLNMSVLWWKGFGVAVSKSHQLNSAPLLSGWEGFGKIELSDHEMEGELRSQPDVPSAGHRYPMWNGRRSCSSWDTDGPLVILRELEASWTVADTVFILLLRFVLQMLCSVMLGLCLRSSLESII